MTQNQDETYFHDLGHEGACTAFYRGCFGNLFGGTRTPMFDGFSRVLMDLICFDGLQFHKWFLMVSDGFDENMHCPFSKLAKHM